MKTNQILALLVTAIFTTSLESNAQCTLTLDVAYNPNPAQQIEKCVGNGYVQIYYNATGGAGSVLITRPDGSDTTKVYNTNGFGNVYSIQSPDQSDNGLYTVTFTATTGCSVTETKMITTYPTVNASVAVTLQSGWYCDSIVNFYLEDNAGPNGPYTYWWTDGTTTQTKKVNSMSPQVPYPQGSIVTNTYGCYGTANPPFTNFNHYPAYRPDITTDMTILCTGQSAHLTAYEADEAQNNYSHEWRKAGQIIGTTKTITVGTGVYKVRATNLGGCISKYSATMSIKNIKAAFTPDGPLNFCQGGSVLFTADLQDASLDYQWKKNNVNIAGETNTTYTATTAGNYKLMVTKPGSCTVTSAKKTVTITCRQLGSNIETGEDALIVFQNQSSGYFSLYSDIEEPVYVTDLTGRMIEKIDPKSQKEFGQNYQPGVYIIESGYLYDMIIKK